jgi:hypothetical protein
MAGEAVRTMRSRFVIPKQSIYEESSTALHSLGDCCALPGARIFTYCKNGAVALTDGHLLQAAGPVALHANRAVAAATVVGATRISVGMGASAAAANYYAEGYLHFNDVAPEGSLYKVKSHLAITGSDTVWFNLYDPLVKVTTTSSEVTLTKAKEDCIIVAPNAALTAPVVGVSLIDVTIGYYFWAQTYGPCPVLISTGATIVIGQPVGLGGTDDGAIGPIAAFTTDVVGTAMQVETATEYALIFLKISA